METEKRIDRLESKLDDLKDFCTDEFKGIAVSLAKLEAATNERNKFWSKSTIKLFVAVLMAILGSFGISAASTDAAANTGADSAKE
jgi:hypothetical protein